jgi:hypothetical protein
MASENRLNYRRVEYSQPIEYSASTMAKTYRPFTPYQA